MFPKWKKKIPKTIMKFSNSDTQLCSGNGLDSTMSLSMIGLLIIYICEHENTRNILFQKRRFSTPDISHSICVMT